MLPEPPSDRSFNNADSFAQAFDQAWGHCAAAAGDAGEATLERVLAQLSDHPFAAADPVTARQVGEFRIRLLGL